MKAKLWTSRILTAWIVLFLLFDAAVKLLRLPVAVAATVDLGYPEGLVVGIGVLELICLVAYAIPRSSFLGAILLTGFLGGATATKVRLEDPWFLFSVAVGGLVWGALWLRDDRVRTALAPS